MSNKPYLYFRCSSLSHTDFCNIRAKIETFNKSARHQVTPKGSALREGKVMHHDLSFGLYDWERDHIVYGLMPKELTYTKTIEFSEFVIFLRGAYDDLRVIEYHGEKYISFIENFTTSKKYPYQRMLQAKIRQLQLYLYMFKEEIERLGYKLWKRSYVEVYSQKTKQRIKRIPVEYDSNIEQWIKHCAEMFLGLAKMSVAPYAYCRLCPLQVKKLCSYFEMRKYE